MDVWNDEESPGLSLLYVLIYWRYVNAAEKMLVGYSVSEDA